MTARMANTITGTVAKPRRVKINIATPSHSDMYCGDYVGSLFRLVSIGKAKGIDFTFSKVNYSDIEVSRNYLVSNFYFNQPDSDFILFIDDDMGFEETMIFDMLALNKPVVGVISPKRTIDLRKLHQLKDVPFEKAIAQSSEFIGKRYEPLEYKNGFVRMESCGAGIMLISRGCIRAMVKAIPGIMLDNSKGVLNEKLKTFVGAFTKFSEDGKHYSEDISFCHRWTRECGGEIWAAPDRYIRHVGKFAYNTRHSDLA